MPATKKPAFTDVDGIKVHANLVDIDGNLRLKLVDENDNQILLLNFYDAKQLSAAVEMFLGQRYGDNFAKLDGNISLEDRKELFHEELEEKEEELDADCEDDVLADNAHGAACNCHSFSHFVRVVIHEDDIGGFYGGITSGGTH